MLYNQSVHKISTAEGITFPLPLAGPVNRFLAFLIDFFVILLINKIVHSIFSLFFLMSADVGNAFLIIGYFVISVGYTISFETFWNGQTIGKKLFKIKVIDQNSLQAGFQQIFIRNILRFVDALPAFYLVGGISILFSKKFQRLGDIAANTLVIRTVKPTIPNLNLITRDKFNSLLDYPHLTARLRDRVSQQEAELILDAILRRDEIISEKRILLFEQLADHFKTIVPFPEEVIENISDEQYLRNLLYILFSKK
ncbi:MAG: RDD family protein [Candidatus Cloacimonetes bacterium]|nr:RDD family protein [Candidatus Cloacimonadota bacterium]